MLFIAFHFYYVLMGLCQSSRLFLPASYLEDLGSILSQSLQELWWKLAEDFLLVLLLSTVGIIPQLLHSHSSINVADSSGRAVWAVGLWPLACWVCGFESRRGNGCLSDMSVVCCQVEFSATSWSLVQRSPTDCGICLSVIVKHWWLEMSLNNTLLSQ
jgi:hypothetical protein